MVRIIKVEDKPVKLQVVGKSIDKKLTIKIGENGWVSVRSINTSGLINDTTVYLSSTHVMFFKDGKLIKSKEISVLED